MDNTLTEASQKYGRQSSVFVVEQAIATNAFLAGAEWAKGKSAGVWVDASVLPKKTGWYHTDIGLIQLEYVGAGIYGQDPPLELKWLNRHGGHVSKWLDESTPTVEVDAVGFKFAEWCSENSWYYVREYQQWQQTQTNNWKTSAELYTLYKQCLI